MSGMQGLSEGLSKTSFQITTTSFLFCPVIGLLWKNLRLDWADRLHHSLLLLFALTC